MTPAYSRSLIGERAFFSRPGNNGGNISIIGAIRLNEEIILRPFHGPIDGDRFIYFLCNYLVPKLKDGDVVILDNCRIHYIDEVALTLDKVGAKALYLPPYSPELNPIEEVWSLIKAALKAMSPRSICEYIDALCTAKKLVTSAKILAYFNHAYSHIVVPA